MTREVAWLVFVFGFAVDAIAVLFYGRYVDIKTQKKYRIHFSFIQFVVLSILFTIGTIEMNQDWWAYLVIYGAIGLFVWVDFKITRYCISCGKVIRSYEVKNREVCPKCGDKIED